MPQFHTTILLGKAGVAFLAEMGMLQIFVIWACHAATYVTIVT